MWVAGIPGVLRIRSPHYTSPHHPTRPKPPRRSVPPPGAAVDPDALDAVRRSAWIRVGRGVDVALGVEQDEVGPLPRLDTPAIREAEPVRRPGRQARDGLLHREQAFAHGETPEEARSGRV